MRQIWIVDDDEEMGRAVGLMLKVLDCEPTLYLSARSTAQSLLTGKKPDLMIVDLSMPEVTGLDLIEFLRRRPEWKDMPIVVLSSEAADSMVDRVLQHGADSYITKPVTLEELEKAIKDAFSRHKIGE
ncbi:MAG: response regulator [Syntrophothermus sp.]